MDRIDDLVQQLEPETAPPSADVQARQRDALLRSMARADEERTLPRHWRPRHKGWFVAISGAAAVAVVVAVLVVGSSSSPRPPAVTPGSSAVLAAITRALADTSDDIEEVQTTAPGAPVSTTSWVDLSTGACRVDTSLNGQPSLTLFVESGSAVVIDYGLQEWWTRSTEGLTCEPLTPQTIEQDVTTGQYTVAGHAIVDAQSSLKLVSMGPTTGLHPVAKLTTLWVNATTYLPIQSTSTGHLTAQTLFAWLPATAANTAILDMKVPSGFRMVVAPPSANANGQVVP
jgi:hypothetical protein